jgi:hypothetical protein
MNEIIDYPDILISIPPEKRESYKKLYEELKAICEQYSDVEIYPIRHITSASDKRD